MPRGAPDYQVLQTQTIKQTTASEYVSAFDIGFSRIDQGGRVIWFDDFRAGISRMFSFGITGADIPRLDAGFNKMYGYYPSIKLQSNVLNGNAVVGKQFSAPASGILGVEFSVYLESLHSAFVCEFGGVVSGYAGWQGFVAVRPSTNIVQIPSSAGLVTVYTPQNANNMLSRWLSMKITFEPLTGNYKEFIIGGKRIDISAYYMEDPIIDEGGTVFFDFYVNGEDAVNVKSANVGYVIMTADEP